MPQSIPGGLTAEHVRLALAELDRGVAHAFGTPTGYELVHEGRRYPPKAVIGLACRHLLGRTLNADEFSGGEAPGQANFVLRKLGFTVVKKGEKVVANWSETEVRLIVADYFDMLEQELLGQKYNKKEHRKVLVEKLKRKPGSVEFKHANISAVLATQGLPYIEGYKPRSNYQGLLETEVEAFLDRNPAFLGRLADAPVVNPGQAPADLDLVFEAPPEEIVTPGGGKPWLSRKGRRIDFAERDAANRQLGRLGEEFVLRLERHRLTQNARDDLARKVQWVAQEVGDGLGFDILSFEVEDGSERLIEVKTTGLGKYHGFYVTATEVRCSEDVGERFHLFRVFDFARAPRAYVLTGSLRERCRLEATQYRASL